MVNGTSIIHPGKLVIFGQHIRSTTVLIYHLNFMNRLKEYTRLSKNYYKVN